MFNSIGSKFAAVAAALIILTAIVIGATQYLVFRNNQLDLEYERLDQEIQKSSDYMKFVSERLSNQVLFLSETPPIQGVIRASANGGVDPFDGTTEDLWKDRLAQIFHSMTANNPEIVQIRYIGVADGGRELVRVNRRHGIITRVKGDGLQKKGEEPYFEKAIRAPAHKAYIFDITLNREYGRIEEPKTPMMRGATPIFDIKGNVFGFIIINIEVKKVLERLSSTMAYWNTYYLTNEHGDYLIHPDESMTFGFEFGARHNIQDDYPLLTPLFDHSGQHGVTGIAKSPKTNELIVSAKIPLDPHDPSRYLVAMATTPMNRFSSQLNEAQSGILFLAAFMAIFAAGVIYFAARRTVTPLRNLTDAAKALETGAELNELSIACDRRDEVGELGRSFLKMAEAIEDRQTELEEEQERIRTILETAVCPIITINDRGVIQSANPATGELFGYSVKDDLLGNNISILMPPEHRDKHDDYLKTYQRTRVAGIIGKGRIVEAQKHDGTLIPVHLAVSEVHLPDKMFYTGVITDLTEQQKAERAKNEFISTVSHELRTPLTSIKGVLELMRSSALGEMPDKAKGMLAIAYKNCDRLVNLINDILDIERIESQHFSLNCQQMHIAPFLKKLVDKHEHTASLRGLKLELALDQHDIVLNADSERLAQALDNVISNAIKFSFPGAAITIKASQSDSWAHISVIDRGKGIASEFHDQIFKKFAQADASDTKSQGGTGLGLAISKAIVDAHGGRIGFESAVGKGTVIHIDIPAVEEIRTSGDAYHTGKILICEDDQDTATLIELIVKNMGLHPVVCKNAQEAKETLAKNNIEAMTLDLSLPGQNGVSLIRELRDDPQFERLPILVISANIESGECELQGQAINVVDWLEKPIDIGLIQNGIKRAIDKLHGGRSRILHIEDDEDLLEVTKSLIDDKAVVDCARTCKEAKFLLHANDYDLVILDLILPDGDGEELLPLITANGTTSPQVLVFSSKDLSNTHKAGVKKAMLKSRITNEAFRRQILACLDPDSSTGEGTRQSDVA